jgi:hypothetical protein
MEIRCVSRGRPKHVNGSRARRARLTRATTSARDDDVVVNGLPRKSEKVSAPLFANNATNCPRRNVLTRFAGQLHARQAAEPQFGATSVTTFAIHFGLGLLAARVECARSACYNSRHKLKTRSCLENGQPTTRSVTCVTSFHRIVHNGATHYYGVAADKTSKSLVHRLVVWLARQHRVGSVICALRNDVTS